MSTQVTNDGAVAIYDSVTGLPYRIAVFEDEWQAEDFLRWFGERHDEPLKGLTVSELEEEREAWFKARLDSEGNLLHDQ